MKVELLFCAGCPNYLPTLEKPRRVMAVAGIDEPIAETEVRDEVMAERLRFPGSPTVLVNGRDIEEGIVARASMGCRIYHQPETDHWGGIPAEETILRALKANLP